MGIDEGRFGLRKETWEDDASRHSADKYPPLWGGLVRNTLGDAEVLLGIS